MTKRDGRPSAPKIDLHGAFLRRTNWSDMRLAGADLRNADLTNASFRNSDFIGARLAGTVLRGADLTDATNLTIDQLAEAIVDENTKLPASIDRNALVARSKTAVPAI